MEPQVVDQLYKPAPPDQLQVHTIDVSPYQDGHKVKAANDPPPFWNPSDIDLVISTPRGKEGLRASIIGLVDKESLLAFPRREKGPSGSYAAYVFLQFHGEGLLNRYSIRFAIPQALTAEGE